MRDAKIKRILMRILAMRDMLLERADLTEKKVNFVKAERAALHAALVKLELYDDDTFEDVKEDVRATWRQPSAPPSSGLIQ